MPVAGDAILNQSKSRLARALPSRPRIALVTDAIFPYHHGGKEIRTHELAQRLTRYAEVHVYTMKWWTGSPVRVDGEVTFHGVVPRMDLYVGGRRSISQALFFALGCIRLACARFDALEADHMPYWHLLPLWAITRLRRKRFVVTWHEAWGRDYWQSYMGIAGILGWWLERLSMRLPDVIVAASPYTASRLQQWVRPHTIIIVAPNGIDISRVESVTAPPLRQDVICVGRLMSHKRVDLLIDAIGRLRDRGTIVTCKIVGDGRERVALQLQTERLGLNTQVSFDKDISSQEGIYAELKASRLFVLTSEREGFGIAALEALACGLPVLTTSAPDNMARHLVARSARGLICRPDIGELAAGIAASLDGRGASTAGHESWLSEFDWNVIAQRVSEALLA